MSHALEDKALHQLQQEQSKLLDKIDELRTIGVGGLVELPQLIVCGNQSSGKSSVLEAISRVRFPAKSNVCTRFATEVILRRNPSSKIKVSIEPGPSRADEQERQRLRSFAYEDFSNGEDLPPLIEKAKEHMGITESVNAGFSDDVLKVEISGPDKPELTLVDLPGLYYSTSQEQDLQGILIVRKLTERYMKNPRSIILAVISAKTDYHLQEVLNIAERYDPKRERTLGIITQPDILEANSEEEDTYLQFIKNQKIHLETGWHVLRNRSFETRDISDDARDEMEKAFFNQGRWTSLSRECVGIESLRRRLSTILLKLIRRNLPGLIAEIQDKVSDRQQQLSRLGPPRSTLQQQRGYLLNISSKFERIIVQALNGMYADEFFGGLEETRSIEDFRRLRAVIRQLNDYFADAMAIRGCRRKIVDRRSFFSNGLQVAAGNPYMDVWEPEVVERSSLEAEVAKQARNNRGIELPGNANQLLVGSLFRDQSKPWESLAKEHLMKAWESAKYFTLLIVQHITDDHTYSLLIGAIIDGELEKLKQLLLEKLDELTAYTKRGHPLPVGKSFLSQIQKARSNRQLASLKTELLFRGFEGKEEKLYSMKDIEHATSKMETSRDEFAAAEIIDQMEAYYETAIVTFVDNVATLAIENCLLDPLQRIFTSQVVNNMDDDQIRELSMEQPYIHEERQRLGRELDKLQAGLRALGVFNTQKPSLSNPPLFVKRPVAGLSDDPGSSLQKSRPGPTITSANGNPFTVTEATATFQSSGPTKAAEPKPPSGVALAQASPAASGTLSNTSIPEQKSVSGGSGTSSSEHKPVPSLFGPALSEQKPIPLSGGFGGGFGTGLSKQKTVSSGFGTAPSEHKPFSSLFSPALSEKKPVSGGFGTGISTSTSTKPTTGTSTGTATTVQQSGMGSTSKRVVSPFDPQKIQGWSQNL
ncbi:interferon-induced GTP-binding protein Mx [Aspergillus udagawae]|uniref:Interferon-induced GTP-binding protein Mx n=1 Tax=Aspergillus udagawae TaxID=91492 RepID=A0ABQ1BA07_9EURO|nr:interferon-induced GTP-binding protein Mx [Aspergillus udagawae]